MITIGMRWERRPSPASAATHATNPIMIMGNRLLGPPLRHDHNGPAVGSVGSGGFLVAEEGPNTTAVAATDVSGPFGRASGTHGRAQWAPTGIQRGMLSWMQPAPHRGKRAPAWYSRAARQHAPG